MSRIKRYKMGKTKQMKIPIVVFEELHLLLRELDTFDRPNDILKALIQLMIIMKQR